MGAKGQGWQHNLWGPMQNENTGKKVQLKVLKYKDFFFESSLILIKHNRRNSDTQLLAYTFVYNIFVIILCNTINNNT